MLPRAARLQPPAGRCVLLTAFFFLSILERPVQPAGQRSQRQILPGNRFPALRLAPPIRGPDGGGVRRKGGAVPL